MNRLASMVAARAADASYEGNTSAVVSGPAIARLHVSVAPMSYVSGYLAAVRGLDYAPAGGSIYHVLGSESVARRNRRRFRHERVKGLTVSSVHRARAFAYGYGYHQNVFPG